jgi:hypothetical protein
MVPKLHKKGTNFRGAATYLLRDIGAESSHRVAWTDVRNLATRDPNIAWRVMAATAMDQDRLKRQAGIANTGRKSNLHVLHFSLAWHPEEAQDLNRQEMMRAVTTMLHVMKAQDHQALVVAHTDGAPHVHVLVNRVHPEDGRILSSSFEKLKASRWAQKYEQERGKIYCEQRVVNNEARKRGEYTRGKKDKARHVHEIDKAAANDNDRKQGLLENHRREAFALKQARREQLRRHAQAWDELEAKHQRRTKLIDEKSRQYLAQSKTRIRERYRPVWESRFHEQQADRKEFERKEARLLGRVQNALRSIDFGSLIGRGNGGRVKTIAKAFQLLGSAGARLQELERRQAVANERLRVQQQREETAAEERRKQRHERHLSENRRRFEAERSSLVLVQAMDEARFKTLWLEKNRRMREEWQKIRQEKTTEPVKERQPLSKEFEVAAGRAEPEKSTAGAGDESPTRPTLSRTSAADLLPQKRADEAAERIDQWRRIREDWFERGRSWRRDRDGDRER